MGGGVGVLKLSGLKKGFLSYQRKKEPKALLKLLELRKKRSAPEARV